MHGAILCGLGEWGVEVAGRIAQASGDRSSLATVTGTHRIAPEDVLSSARSLLSHERLVRARDAPGDDGPTQLVVIVIAHLREAAVREGLAATLSSIEERLLAELGPILAPARAPSRPLLRVAPLIAMPYPRSHPEGTEVAAAARSLAESIGRSAQRATPRLWLIEDVAELSILSSEELAQSVRNFALLLLGARELEPIDRLVSSPASAPISTFACAVAELPRNKLARWATDEVAIELLDAVLDAPLPRSSLPAIDALEEVEIGALDPDKDAAHVVRDLLERYAPKIEPDARPEWHESAEALRARYGPDHGDPSLDEPQPPPERPTGFALGRMREIEDAWRLLQRRRFDDVVARERVEAESMRGKLEERIAARVDRELWSQPAPDAFRRATELVSKLHRAVTVRLEEAVAERDSIRPDAAPSFAHLASRHAELLDAARRKPDLGAMALWGLLTWGGCVTYVPSLLVAFAVALDAQPEDWYQPLLTTHATLTAAVLGLIAILGFFAARIVSTHLAVLDAHRAMWNAIRDTVSGSSRSVATYFTTRLRLSRLTARVQALLAVRAALERDREALILSERAARRARASLREGQRSLGAIDRDGHPSLGAMLRGTETLIEGMVGPGAERALAARLPEDGKSTRVLDVLRSLAEGQSWAKRWREEVPFSSLEALRAGARPHAEAVARWDPLAEADDGERTAAQLAAFFRRQARSLRIALDLEDAAAHEGSAISGLAVVPAAALAGVRSELDREPSAAASIRCVRGPEDDRAYWLVAITDIPIERVASLGGRERITSTPAELPRFEVEESS